MRDARDLGLPLCETPLLDFHQEQEPAASSRSCREDRWQPRWTILFSFSVALVLWAMIVLLIF